MHKISQQILAVCVVAGLGACRNFEWDEGNWYDSSASEASDEVRVREASAPRSAAQPKSTSAPLGMVSSRVAFPTGDVNTSSLLLEKVSPAEVQLGKAYSYETRVTNLANFTLENVIVTETSDPNFEMTDSEPKAASAGSGGTQWLLGNLAPNATRTITVSGRARTLSSINNCVSASYNTALCSVTQVVSPQLRLVASGPSEILQCDELEYTYVVSNPGSGVALDVVVHATLPEGLMVAGSSSFSHAVGNLAAGASSEFKLKATPSQTGRFQHIAMARAAGDLEAQANGVATTVRKPKLEVEMDGPSSRVLGREASYEITVKNVGDAGARETLLETMLPLGAKVTQASSGSTLSDGKVSWNIGELPAGKGIKFRLQLGTDTIGTLSASSSVKAYCADSASTSISTTVVGIAAVLLEVVDVEDPIEVGANETYVIRVTNQGTAPATNLNISILLPEHASFVGLTGSTQATSGAGVGRTLRLLPLASLAPKAEAVWRVVLKCNQASDARFKVSLTSDQLTRPVEESEATTFYD